MFQSCQPGTVLTCLLQSCKILVTGIAALQVLTVNQRLNALLDVRLQSMASTRE